MNIQPYIPGLCVFAVLLVGLILFGIYCPRVTPNDGLRTWIFAAGLAIAAFAFLVMEPTTWN